MKIYLAYRFTGENHEELKNLIQNIGSILENAGHTYFCTFWHGDFFSENKFTHKQILEHALNELNKSDAILAVIRSEEKSEGMLLEIGYALAKKKRLILAIKKDVKTVFVREMADQIIEFKTPAELYKKLSKLK